MSEIEISSVPEPPANYDYSAWNTESSSFIYNAEDMNYQVFFDNHLMKNVPCIVKNITTDWECAKKWVDENGQIKYDYLSNTYGELKAPVANCSNPNFNSHCKVDMKVKDYMEYLKKEQRNEVLYLKDWHLKRTLPNDKFYMVPNIFASDWLNELSIDNQEDDYMFVYIGPKDSWFSFRNLLIDDRKDCRILIKLKFVIAQVATEAYSDYWTPLHSDVFNSYSWSVNLNGRKKWLLLPPGEELKLKDNLRNLPIKFNPTIHTNVKYFEVTQEKGDALFMPSGWHHQVINELDTISINHNWVNGCNIALMWKALSESLINVEFEIQEFKDTPEFFVDCQLVLKLYFGMAFEEFICFLMSIAEKRLAQLIDSQSSGLMFSQYYFGKNHIKFDLKCLLNAMDLVIAHPDIVAKKMQLDSYLLRLRSKVIDALK